MSRFSDLSFLRDKELNAIYLTLSLSYLGAGLVSVFVPIYLWILGYELWLIFLFLLLESLWFVCGTFIILPFFRGISDRKLFLLSIPLLALFFIGLHFLQTYPFLFFILPALQGIDRLFFDTAYHLDFTHAVDKKYIGRELGTQFIVLNIFTFGTPFIGGVIAASFGFSILFTVSVVILILAFLPLFLFPANHISTEINRKLLLRYVFNLKTLPHTLSNIGYALESIISRYIWPLYIFIFLGSLKILGAIISLGLLFGGIIQYISGFFSDSGKRSEIIKIFVPLYSLIWVIRAFVSNVIPFTVAHIGGDMMLKSFGVAWDTYNYDLAKETPHPAIFMLSRILTYHMARIIFWPILIVLSYLLPLKIFFISSFIIAAILSLLYFSVLKQKVSSDVFKHFMH